MRFDEKRQAHSNSQYRDGYFSTMRGFRRPDFAALKSKAINEWRLFWLIAGPMSILMVIAMLGADMSTGAGVSKMIRFSVRFAVPFIFLVVAASAVQRLFPGPFPAWWLRNRKYIGMCFAVAMAWQGTFIFTMSNLFRDYYYAEVVCGF